MSIPDRVQRTMAEQRRQDGEVTGQAIWWDPSKWQTPNLKAAVQLVAEHTDARADERSLITRQNVFDLITSQHDPMTGFVGAMIWGYGINGLGPHRVETLVGDAGARIRGKLDGIADAAGEDAAAAWDAFTAKHKIDGLGPAFASKYAYFVAFADGPPATDTPPLIVDANTSWAMWDLMQLARSVERRSGYLEYVHIAVEWAREARVRADTVEWALFEIGKAVPRL